MNQLHLILFAPLLTLLAWASVTDCRSRRIPNWITAGLALGGLLTSFLPQSGLTPLGSIEGFGVGFGLSFLIYLMGGQGAGDVKLLAAVGSWMGPAKAMEVFVLAALVSMVVAIGYVLVRGRMTELCGSSMVAVWRLITERRAPVVGSRSIGKPLPHAPVIFAATVCVLLYRARIWSGGVV